MSGAAFRIGALMLLLCLSATVGVAQEEDAGEASAIATAEEAKLAVTDRDRMWVNFSRESAVLGQNRFWVELRGMIQQMSNNPTLGLSGYTVTNYAKKNGPVETINGGRFDLVGAYGLGKAGEIGLDMPFVMQESINGDEFADVGDLLLYGKFKQELAEHWSGAVGMELSAPTGSESKILGSGDLGLNPFLSTRYQSGRMGLGGHLGFLLNTGSQPDVFNWSVQFIARANQLLALRTEVNGRLFRGSAPGERNGMVVSNTETINDIAIWPGLDFNLTDYFIIRPEGLVHATDDAINWGIGIGLAFTM